MLRLCHTSWAICITRSMIVTHVVGASHWTSHRDAIIRHYDVTALQRKGCLQIAFSTLVGVPLYIESLVSFTPMKYLSSVVSQRLCECINAHVHVNVNQGLSRVVPRHMPKGSKRLATMGMALEAGVGSRDSVLCGSIHLIPPSTLFHDSVSSA
ncbi:hypothetical protein PAXRUDRAFT_485747 [Paxillus rubicundulus Ve08.2h10]|uniref:Uncharacterized protein n=1 Tax=Paxillus rubicundulus Ve08.2h10 TaxID=930991 RepID=A0A0D0DPL1_9AGAM|nr:hypothetical protein PAXRUDRAFT_485747 [Paxillus rubicundulus Ve08.2h10]